MQFNGSGDGRRPQSKWGSRSRGRNHKFTSVAVGAVGAVAVVTQPIVCRFLKVGLRVRWEPAWQAGCVDCFRLGRPGFRLGRAVRATGIRSVTAKYVIKRRKSRFVVHICCLSLSLFMKFGWRYLRPWLQLDQVISFSEAYHIIKKGPFSIGPETAIFFGYSHIHV